MWADTLNLIQQRMDNCISEAAGGLESPAPLLTASAWDGMSWMVWGTSQGGRAVFWPNMCLLHTGTSGLFWRTGLQGWHMLCRARRCHLSAVGVLPMCLTLAGAEEIPANGSSLSGKSLCVFTKEFPWNNLCLCMLARKQIMACWEQCCGNQHVYTWEKGRTFHHELVCRFPGRGGLADLKPGSSPCCVSMSYPPLALRYQGGLSVACACWWSDWLRSTATRIQVTRSSRSRYRQSGVFIAVTLRPYFKIIHRFCSNTSSSEVWHYSCWSVILCFEDKVHLVLVHCGKVSGTKSLSSSVFSNLALNVNFPRVVFFFIPSSLTSLQLGKRPRI